MGPQDYPPGRGKRAGFQFQNANARGRQLAREPDGVPARGKRLAGELGDLGSAYGVGFHGDESRSRYFEMDRLLAVLARKAFAQGEPRGATGTADREGPVFFIDAEHGGRVSFAELLVSVRGEVQVIRIMPEPG